MIGVAVLGSTGSIGESTLDVLGRHPERFKLVALGANRNAAKLAEQVLALASRVRGARRRERGPRAATDIGGPGPRNPHPSPVPTAWLKSPPCAKPSA